MHKPNESEYNPYFKRYIDLVEDGDYRTLYENNTIVVSQFFENIPLEKETYQYAEGKWTIKQMLLHIIDTERIFAYRLLVILRRDAKTTLSSFNVDLYATAASTDTSNRPLKDIVEEFKAVRAHTFYLLKYLTENKWTLSMEIGNAPLSVGAIAYIILGHPLHHLKIIKERYL